MSTEQHSAPISPLGSAPQLKLRPRPTKEELSSILSYDSSTGIFRWVNHPKVAAGMLAGGVKKDGYVRIMVNGRNHLAHQLAWVISFGDWPEKSIDHINGNPSDNRIANLRLATHSQNTQNATLRRDNTSGFKGVSYMKSANKWYARIYVNGATHYLGLFLTAEEAHQAYRKSALALHGEFAPQIERTVRHG